MKWLILLIPAVPVVIFFVIYLRQTRPRQTTIMFASGTLGSGKSITMITFAVRNHRKELFRCSVRRRLQKLFRRPITPLPEFYTTQPVLYRPIPLPFVPKIRSRVLRVGHLINYNDPKYRMPENSTVYFGEVGAVLGQWDYANEKVITRIEPFFRFFRHFVNGRIFMDDQNVERLAKPLRDCLGDIIQCLCTARYPLFYLHRFVRVEWRAVSRVDDNHAQILDPKREGKNDYTLIRLPRRSKALWSGRPYAPIYQQGITDTPDWEEGKLTTRYLINIKSDGAKKGVEKWSWLDENVFTALQKLQQKIMEEKSNVKST